MIRRSSSVNRGRPGIRVSERSCSSGSDETRTGAAPIRSQARSMVDRPGGLAGPAAARGSVRALSSRRSRPRPGGSPGADAVVRRDLHALGLVRRRDLQVLERVAGLVRCRGVEALKERRRRLTLGERDRLDRVGPAEIAVQRAVGVDDDRAAGRQPVNTRVAAQRADVAAVLERDRPAAVTESALEGVQRDV